MLFAAFIISNLIVGAAAYFVGFANGARQGMNAPYEEPQRDTWPSPMYENEGSGK